MIIEQLKSLDDTTDFVGIATMLKALGDPTRLEIFRFLTSCSEEVAVEETGDVRPVAGPTVGDVCCRVTGKAQSSSLISHHLKELRIAGLIVMERRGRNLICSANRSAAHRLSVFFADEHIQDESTCC